MDGNEQEKDEETEQLFISHYHSTTGAQPLSLCRAPVSLLFVTLLVSPGDQEDTPFLAVCIDSQTTN